LIFQKNSDPLIGGQFCYAVGDKPGKLRML